MLAIVSDIETLASSNYVHVGDAGSNAHGEGCGDRAALSGGFANKFDPVTSKQFLFGLNPVGRTSDFPFPNTPLPFGPSWRVTVANWGSGTRGGGRQITYAYCVKRPPRLRIAEGHAWVGGHATATATARCRRGTEAVSGGFSSEWAGTHGVILFGFRSVRVGARRWQASGINRSDKGERLFAYAMCRPRAPELTELRRTLKVPRGGTRSTRLACGPGLTPWSGGFESDVDGATAHGAYPYVHKRVGQRSWKAAAFAEGPAASFTAHVYCGPSP